MGRIHHLLTYSGGCPGLCLTAQLFKGFSRLSLMPSRTPRKGSTHMRWRGEEGSWVWQRLDALQTVSAQFLSLKGKGSNDLFTYVNQQSSYPNSFSNQTQDGEKQALPSKDTFPVSFKSASPASIPSSSCTRLQRLTASTPVPCPSPHNSHSY